MLWAGLTGTWPWTRLVAQTGLKTLWTALLLWMRSSTSSTSSQLFTAWPTSGSRPFASPCINDMLHVPISYEINPELLHSKFLLEGSQRVGVSASGKTKLEFSAFIRPDGSVVLIVLNRYSLIKSVWICVTVGQMLNAVCVCQVVVSDPVWSLGSCCWLHSLHRTG